MEAKEERALDKIQDERAKWAAKKLEARDCVREMVQAKREMNGGVPAAGHETPGSPGKRADHNTATAGSSEPLI